MVVKMKVLVWGSQVSCVITLIVVFVVFAVSLHHLKTEHRQISVPAIVRWRTEVTRLLCVCGYIAVFTGLWAWLASRYQKVDKFIVAFVLFSLIAGFSFGLHATIVTYELSQQDQLEVDAVFDSTKSTITSGIKTSGDETWVPPWLNAIQEESKTCCGVRTFNDYSEFWEPIKNRVPKSCCRNGGESSSCHTDMQTIPFPDTVANNIKVDRGCYEEIVAKITQILCEAFTLSIVVTASIAFTLLVFLVEYFCAYCVKSAVNPEDLCPGQVFRTDEQTWQTLDLFPVRKDNKNIPGDLAAISGEMLNMDNKTTNTDLTAQAQSPEAEMKRKQNIQVTSQETMTIESTSFIPEVNLLPEIGSDPSLHGSVIIEQQLLQQEPSVDLEYFQPRPRTIRTHHRRHNR